MFNEVCLHLADLTFKNVRYDYFEEAHKGGHDRVELRRYWISDILDTISNPGRWVSLQSIGMVESERYIDGKIISETRYFIVSIAPDAKIFAMRSESTGPSRISCTGYSMSHLEKTIPELGETMLLRILACLDMLRLMNYVTKNHVKRE